VQLKLTPKSWLGFKTKTKFSSFIYYKLVQNFFPLPTCRGVFCCPDAGKWGGGVVGLRMMDEGDGEGVG
jgi:hypothetical protein